MAKSPSGIVRQGTFNLLNATFNTTLATAVADYSGLAAFTINFAAGAASNSFFYGRLDIDDIIESSPILRSHNILTLFNIQSKNLNLEKPATFSGHVTSGVDIWISYLKGSAQQDFESMPECLENVLYNIFNARSSANYWGNRVSFNGNIQVGIGPLIKTDVNWRRLITATLLHEVSI